MVAPSPAPPYVGGTPKRLRYIARRCSTSDQSPPTEQAAVAQRKNIGSNCSFTHAAMIEYDDPPRGYTFASGSGCLTNGVHLPCKRLGLKFIRIKPYTPKTNGKAERLIQTSLREWAYARAYNTSDERTAELPRWLHRYNWHRPHGSIGSKPPTSRLALTGNNLLKLHS